MGVFMNLLRFSPGACLNLKETFMLHLKGFPLQNQVKSESIIRRGRSGLKLPIMRTAPEQHVDLAYGSSSLRLPHYDEMYYAHM